MAKITQKQLIEQLRMLKEIKPRQEWASLLKSQILAEKPAFAESFGLRNDEVSLRPDEVGEAKKAKSVSIMDVLASIFYQRQTAYAFATLAILVIGVLGFAKYTMPGDALFPIKKIAEQSQASLLGQTTLSKDVASLNSRVNDLAQVAKEGKTNNIPSAIDEIKINASELAKNLKDNPANSQTLKDIANTLKVLADVPGTDLSQIQDVQDLYQAVASGQIADLQKTTLTDEQKTTLTKAEDLYSQEKYSDALEQILLINK